MTASEAVAYLLHEVPADEPVFILRAQDKIAANVIFEWIKFAKAFGVQENKVNGAATVLQEFLYFEPKKIPD